MRYLRAGAAGGVLLLILGGVPLVLAAVGDPRPGWVDVGVGDVSERAVLDVLASVAWLAWAYFATTVIAEITQIARSVRPGSRLSGPSPAVPGPSRHLARTLLSAVVLALPLAGPSQAFATADSPTAPPAASALPAHGPGVPLVAAGDLAPAGTGAPAPASTAPTAPAATEARTPALSAIGEVREYVITRHGPGTFWDLAQTYLGDGRRWREIWDLNQGRRQADGTRLHSPGVLRIGWTVLIPVSPTDKATPDGDARSADTTARLGYVVREGDRLGAIAERFLGDFSAYPRIRDANRAFIPTTVGADHIEPGWHLTLPAGARDRGRLPHATGPAAHRAPEPEPEHRPSVPAPAPVPSPQPSGAAPPPRSAGPPKVPSPTGNAVAPAQGRPDPGITVPGGWMDLPLAVALVGLAAAVWIRRRLVYLYPPSDEPTGDDHDDLDALPTVVTRLRRAVREHAGRLPASLPGPGELAPAEPVSSICAQAAPELSLSPLRPPPGGLGLIGEGALDAARALLVATLTAAVRSASADNRAVLLTGTALNTLLPGWAVPEGRFGDHLMIGADQEQILALLTAHRQGFGPPGRPLLLITDLPAASDRHRLLQAIQDTGVPTVVLGHWTPGPTLTVEPNGCVSPSEVSRSADRIAVLDEPTAAGLLQVVQEAGPPRHRQRSFRPATAPQDTPARNPATTDPARSTPNRPTAADSADAQQEAPESTGARADPAAATPGRVAVSVLGKPTIYGSDGTPVGGLRRHATELLVYLAVHRNGAGLPAIMEALWPDATVRRAQQRLSTEAANLRRSIRTAAGDPGLQPVVNTGGHYHLDPAIVDIDLWRLLEHLDAASAATDAQRRDTELRAALAVPPGVLAEDSDYDWIEAPREHLRRRTIRALLTLAEHPDSGPREVAAVTTQAADLDPASEDLAQRSIRALAAIGDTPAIHERLDRLRRVLNDIGENPSPSTVTLAAELSATASRVMQ